MKPQSMEEKISYRLFFMGFVGRNVWTKSDHHERW